jgi:N6-L-threonylcarbamoyladenine synthase
VVAGGGVACNTSLRARLSRECDRAGIGLVLAPGTLCTDNAAMVAALGAIRHAAGHGSGLDADIHPNLRLGSPI